MIKCLLCHIKMRVNVYMGSGIRKYVFDVDCSYKDVTNRKGILWGCGKFANDIMEQYNFLDINIVVDGNAEKWGRVFRDDYVIYNPEILYDLKSEMYYIIIGSLEYKDEICGYIDDHFGNLFPICGVVWRDLIFEYENFVDMCEYDRFVNAILLREEMLDCIGDIQNEICGKLNNYLGSFNTHMYRVIPNNGNSLTFVVDGKMFVKIDKRMKKGNPVSIMPYYSGNVDWNRDENILSLFEQLRDLHESVHGNLPAVDLNEKINYLANECKRRNVDFLNGLPDDVVDCMQDEYIIKEVKNYNPVVCHGDFHFDNVVMSYGKVKIIDWDDICMSDPIFDLALFLVVDALGTEYHHNNMRDFLKDWRKISEMYYKHELDRGDISHIKAVSIRALYYYYLLALLYCGMDMHYIKVWFVKRMRLIKTLME